MIALKNKKVITAIFLLSSLGYFTTISGLEIDSFWRGELILIPLQVLALIYVTYQRWGNRERSVTTNNLRKS